jgi:hypothetical protein
MKSDPFGLSSSVAGSLPQPLRVTNNQAVNRAHHAMSGGTFC